MEDKIITCQDCGQEFVFTEGEQKFYAEKNLIIPKRCKSCRDARKNNIIYRQGGDNNGC